MGDQRGLPVYFCVVVGNVSVSVSGIGDAVRTYSCVFIRWESADADMFLDAYTQHGLAYAVSRVEARTWDARIFQ